MNRLQFLGTGWSHGVPTLGCDCPVCVLRKPENIRRRSSILLRAEDGYTVLVDTGPDFRDQALTFGIRQLDAICITHLHADHVMGLDDVRRFTWLREEPLPLFAHPDTQEGLKKFYPYFGRERAPAKAVPLIHFEDWLTPIELGPFTLDPIPVTHGGLTCYGIRIRSEGKDVGYVPDTSGLPPEALEQLAGVDIMILNALRHRPHPSHLSLEQSVALLKEMNPPQAYLTHMGCPIDYHTVQPTLPENIDLATDGLILDLS